MPIKFAKVEPDCILDGKLSAIVLDIEQLLKPYSHKLKTEIDSENGAFRAIRLTAEIKLR